MSFGLAEGLTNWFVVAASKSIQEAEAIFVVEFELLEMESSSD